MRATDSESSFDVPQPILILGAALIIVGLGIALFVAAEALSVYRNTEANAFISYLVQRLSGSELLAIGEQNIVVGQGAATITAVILFFLLAGTGAGVAFALLRAGSQMVSPAFQVQLASIKWRLSQLLREIRKK